MCGVRRDDCVRKVRVKECVYGLCMGGVST